MDIAQLIDENLTSVNEIERKKHKDREIGIFYPSESMQCQRKIYINVIEPKRKKEKMPLGLFHMAKYAEESLIKCIRSKPGIFVREQVRLESEIAPNVTIHGYIDFELDDEEGNTTDIYEIKSTANISYIAKAPEAKLYHRSQLQCYLQTKQCDRGGIIYVERGDICKIKQFDDTLDDDLWNRIKDHFSQTLDFMENRELPPPMPVEAWECTYCEFKSNCAEERKQLGLKLNIKKKK